MGAVDTERKRCHCGGLIMYRVKVEAVSGIHVRAGGKWLTRIGNKNVCVGDYVWTDGRCVYGNTHVPQQPLVITASADEGIPIFLSTNSYTRSPDLCFYTFKKGQLKLEAQTKLAESTYVKTPIMINDYKKDIFFRDDSVINSDENGYVELLAANINRRGDWFEIIVKGSNDDETCFVEIRKNGVVVRDLDIAKFHSLNIWNECPNPPSGIPFVREYVNGFSIFDDAFIEDENNWRFAFSGTAAKGYSDEYTGPYDDSGLDPRAPFAGVFTKYSLSKTYLVTAEDLHLISRHYVEEIDSTGDVNLIARSEKHSNPEAEKVKLLVQDGYYYKWRRAGTSDIGEDYYYSDFFTPTGEKIFSTEFLNRADFVNTSRHFLLAQISNNTYLLSANNDWVSGGGGLWIIKNGGVTNQRTVTQLLARSQCFNQRLRPIPKCRNWLNRLQELTLTE